MLCHDCLLMNMLRLGPNMLTPTVQLMRKMTWLHQFLHLQIALTLLPLPYHRRIHMQKGNYIRCVPHSLLVLTSNSYRRYAMGMQMTLLKVKNGMPGIQLVNGLWYIGGRLIIPYVGDIRETLFRLAHDVLGHFGFDKTYSSLRNSFYWPNM